MVGRGQRFALCYDCQKDDLKKKIKDPKMAKMFAIPEQFYQENGFLRSIKVNYLRFENLSPKQIEAFQRTVAEMKKKKTESQ
jgi:hypothetical protein